MSRSLSVLLGVLAVLALATGSARGAEVSASEWRPPMVAADAPADKLFHWKKVGGDPCNPKVGCTLAWALANAVEKAGWPQEVVDQLKALATTQHGEDILIPAGWRGWMTWGQYVPKFRVNVLADWPPGHVEPAFAWRTTYRGVEYVLIQVRACGNWGGGTRDAPPPPPPAPPEVPLAPLPLALC